ncbi:MAG TPA: ABC transporter substrate-binding protein [Micromonosporaceae bacterium]|nr:ABC transporter substrate-binding protein [Micromonosporaceae bacterium]
MSQVNRRQVLKLLAALGATGVTAACAGDDEAGDTPAPPKSDEPVRIGLLVPQTGGLKAIGEDVVRGFQLYVDLNEGRLGGHPAQIETVAEGDTAATGVDGLKELLRRDVVAVSGVVNPATMMALREPIRQAKVPLVGSVGSPSALLGEVYTWRTSYVSSDAARALGPYVADNVDGKVVMVTTSFATGQDVVEGFREGFGWLDKRLVTEAFFAGENNNPGPGFYRNTIVALQTANPAAVFCDLAGAAAVEFIREYRAAGLQATLYGSGFLTEGNVLTELAEDAGGILTAMNYSADLPNPANQTFASAYRREHDSSPTTYAMASYDAAQVLSKAISLAGDSPTPQQINLMLGKVGQVDSPRGTWQFNQSRTPQQKWYLREVRLDGRVLANVLISELNTLG